MSVKEMLLDAKTALQQAESNKVRKKQELFERLLNPFVIAINNAVVEGESFAAVVVPDASDEDLKPVFQLLGEKNYSVYSNGHEKWLVKFKKQEPTPPVLTEDYDDAEREQEALEEEDLPDYDDSDDDIPF